MMVMKSMMVIIIIAMGIIRITIMMIVVIR